MIVEKYPRMDAALVFEKFCSSQIFEAMGPHVIIAIVLFAVTISRRIVVKAMDKADRLLLLDEDEILLQIHSIPPLSCAIPIKPPATTAINAISSRFITPA